MNLGFHALKKLVLDEFKPFFHPYFVSFFVFNLATFTSQVEYVLHRKTHKPKISAKPKNHQVSNS